MKIFKWFTLCTLIVVMSSCAPAPTVQPTATAPATGKWITTLDKSSFDDSQIVILKLPAERTIKAWLDEPLPYLIIRCKEHKLDVYIFANTQFEVENSSNTSTVRIRFDKDPAMTITMNQSDDGKSLFFLDKPEAVKQIVAHDTLLVGFTPFNAAPVEASFDLRGVTEAIKPAQDACK